MRFSQKKMRFTQKKCNFHRKKCKEYNKILNGFNFKNRKNNELLDYPFLPTKIFKNFDLKSVSENKIIKRLVSSGTTGQLPSKIYLDKENWVGCKNEFSIVATIGPSASDAALLSNHMGSAVNAFHFCSLSARDSHLSIYINSLFDRPTVGVQKPTCSIPCFFHKSSVTFSNRSSKLGKRPGKHS